MNNRLIRSNDLAVGGCTNTVDSYNPFPDGGGLALYQLNGDATDVSGNYNGTATNVTYGAGQFGQGASFNTSNSILTTPRAFSTNASYSVSGWAKIANGSTTQAVYFAWQITGTNQSQVTVSYDDVSTYKLTVNHKFETNSNVSYNFAANDGQWHHYAVTFNGSSANLYIDGSFVESGLLDPKGDVSSTNYIGGTNLYNNITYYNGLDGIDQVRYFNRALRPYEVEALYTEEYCTPTIVPSQHFNTVTYTGNGGTNAITGVGFAPDFVWAKGRSVAYNHWVYDTVRGANAGLLPNLTNSENTTTGVLSSLDSDGFTLGSNGELNQNNATYVSWNFKAGGAAVTNTDGTITSQVSANTEAGFSVVSWTGTGAANATVGHGLGTTPSLYITKRRDSTGNWVLFATTLLPTTGTQEFLVLNATDASSDASQPIPTSSILNVQSVFDNISSATYVSYCFAEVEGFSNFGSYVGNGSTEGNVILTGFEPAFLLIKRTEAAGNDWILYDNKRDPSNPRDTKLSPNTSGAEYTAAGINIDFLENGFQLKGNDSAINAASGTGEYIYMAFAADPTAVEPTLEDSFNTVLYTGNGGTQSVTGVGFQPDFIWLKCRDVAKDHRLYDSVRGVTNFLESNNTDAEAVAATSLTSFDTNGFTLGAATTTNSNGDSFVAWNWKGAEIPAINSNGSIPSVVSANPAAGFSIVSHINSGNTSDTVGHGLNETPEFYITKKLDVATNWNVYTNVIDGSNDQFRLNLTNAKTDSSLQLATSTVFYNQSGTADSSRYITYCFHSVPGFSKFGSYVGTGSAGNAQTLGFEPAFLLIKRTDVAGNGWLIADNKRDTTNPIELFLSPNTSQAEFPVTNGIDFNVTDFTIDSTNGSLNASGGTYIYMAFANQF